jgi:hypothetical protein
MEALEEEWPGCFASLLDEVIESILSPPASSVQLIRTWLLELFVRGVIEIPLLKVKKLDTLPAVIDKGQVILIRGRCGDKNYFRKQKTAIHHLSGIELSALVWGASCLPTDEYRNWLDMVRTSYSRPLGGLFLKWAARNKTELISMLRSVIADHPD